MISLVLVVVVTGGGLPQPVSSPVTASNVPPNTMPRRDVVLIIGVLQKVHCQVQLSQRDEPASGGSSRYDNPSPTAHGQRTVVVSVALRVVATSPFGAMVVPVVTARVLSVVIPSTSVVRWLLLQLVEPDDGATIGAVVTVVVVLVDDVCAKAKPVIKAKIVVAVRQVFII